MGNDTVGFNYQLVEAGRAEKIWVPSIEYLNFARFLAVLTAANFVCKLNKKWRDIQIHPEYQTNFEFNGTI